MVEAQRLAFADLIESCSPSQLEVSSLCRGWRVRDVAGHVLWVAAQPKPSESWRALRAPSPHRFIAREGIRYGHGSPSGLAARLRISAPSRRQVPGLKPVGYLADTICHGLDVTVALGVEPLEVPPEAMGAALAHYLGRDSFTGGRTRTRGLRLVCDDLGVSFGEGSDVTGPAHAILGAAVGRRALLSELAGPGLDELAARP